MEDLLKDITQGIPYPSSISGWSAIWSATIKIQVWLSGACQSSSKATTDPLTICPQDQGQGHESECDEIQNRSSLSHSHCTVHAVTRQEKQRSEE